MYKPYFLRLCKGISPQNMAQNMASNMVLTYQPIYSDPGIPRTMGSWYQKPSKTIVFLFFFQNQLISNVNIRGLPGLIGAEPQWLRLESVGPLGPPASWDSGAKMEMEIFWSVDLPSGYVK